MLKSTICHIFWQKTLFRIVDNQQKVTIIPAGFTHGCVG